MKLRTRNPKFLAGYTLVEMLVVVGIIAVILGLSAKTMKSLASNESVSSSVSVLKRSFNEARVLAKNGNPTRLLIYVDDTDMSLEGMEKYLRQIYFAQKDDSGDWQIVSEGERLAKNSYFDTERSLKNSDGSHNTNHLNDDGSVNLTGTMEVAHNGQTRLYYYYEFNEIDVMSNPMPTNAGEWENQGWHRGYASRVPRAIVGRGQLRRVPGRLTVNFRVDDDEERGYAGFYIYHNGNTVDINELDSIKNEN